MAPRHRWVTAALLLALSAPARAVRFAAPFGNHMVLQQGVPVPIWGSGCPLGESVTVSFAGQKVTAKCDGTSGWIVRLAPMKAGGPYDMVVSLGTGVRSASADWVAGTGGGMEVVDVLVGEVWLFAGPPRTAMRGVANADSEIAGALNGWLHMSRTTGPMPRGTLGPWTYASPDNVGEYPAAAYDFARELYSMLKAPIGVIDISSVGDPGAHYKDMIAPFLPCAIRGVVWDQSESGAQPRSIESLIQEWREALGQGDVPFVYAPPPELQRRSPSLPGAAAAVTSDLGERAEVAPKNRAELGRRLAALARALTYTGSATP